MKKYYIKILRLLETYEPNNPTLQNEILAKPWLEVFLNDKPSRGPQ